MDVATVKMGDGYTEALLDTYHDYALDQISVQVLDMNKSEKTETPMGAKF
jgi:hypothetical protein